MYTQDTVDQMRTRCDELSAREQMYAASWKKDSDVRQQMALEVNSIQVVLEQKNDEIRRLRQRQSELETKVLNACSIISFHSRITVVSRHFGPETCHIIVDFAAVALSSCPETC